MVLLEILLLDRCSSGTGTTSAAMPPSAKNACVSMALVLDAAGTTDMWLTFSEIPSLFSLSCLGRALHSQTFHIRKRMWMGERT